MKRRHGYSLIEVLIATAILGIVMFGLVATFTANQKTHVTVDQVTVTQQNLRVVAEIIESDLRMGGYMVPGHAAVCVGDSETGPDTLYVSDSDAILSVAGMQSEDAEMIGRELGVPITNISAGTSVGGAGMTLVLSERWVDVGSESDFAVGAGVMVVDRNDSEGRVVCGTITSLTEGAGDGVTLVVDFDTAAVTFSSGSTAELAAIPAHVYRVIEPGGGSVDRYQLRRNGVLVANDVEDMQFVLFFDVDDDGVVEAGEVEGDDGSTVGDGVGIAHSPASVDSRNLKQVRVNLVMSTEREDPDQRAPLSQLQITGNRDPGSIDAPDRKKRRVYQSTIRLRNVS